MKVLILGSRGMLGQALLKAFSDRQPIGWDRPDLDVTDPHVVSRRITELRPDLIVNATAYNDVDGAERGDTVAKLVNGEAVGYLAAAARSVGAVFVHYSTDYVFDGRAGGGFPENVPPNPVNAYGRSKFLGEERFAEHTDRGYLIRTSRLFGPRGTAEGTKESFVDLMLRLSRERDSIEVVDEEVSSPTFAPDLAGATRFLLDHRLPFGVYHRTNDGSCTWFGFAQEIFRLNGWRGTLSPVPRSRFPQPAARPAHSILVSTKLPPLRPWRAALADDLRSRISESVN